MRVVIIGGSGHIGSYLTPLLVEHGHDVTSVSRSRREPYFQHPAWESGAASEYRPAVGRVRADHCCAESGSGDRPGSATPSRAPRRLVDALRGTVQQFLHCGTIWVHGPGGRGPNHRRAGRASRSGDYGHRKAEIEAYLLAQAREFAFPATVLHPGHLVGPGWIPLNPAANFNRRTFRDLVQGNEISLPNFGRETLHHVHAEDVAQAFVKAMQHRSVAIGESFHVVVTGCGHRWSDTLEAVASWYGKEARIRFVPVAEWRSSVSEKDAQVTRDHIARSPNCSIEKRGACLAISRATVHSMQSGNPSHGSSCCGSGSRRSRHRDRKNRAGHE